MSPASQLLLAIGDLGLSKYEGIEILDGEAYTESELRGNFSDIERVNRLLGGTRLTMKSIEELVGRFRPGLGFSLLDVGTGSAGIPLSMVRRAERSGTCVHATVADLKVDALAVAGDHLPPSIDVVSADGRDLPFADNAFDYAICSLLLHHLDRHEAVRVLREMGRVASSAIVVNDLVRNIPAYLGATALARFTHNRLSRNDGPLSVRRAYTLKEMFSLVQEAGQEMVRVRQFGLYRVALTAIPS